MKFLQAEALRRYNTLALQARAETLVSVSSDSELLTALAWAREHHLPVVPLGEGSNVVFSGDVPALVLRQQTRGIEVLELDADSVSLRVAAGENWHELVRWTLEQGYYGLQNLALIPGTVGAAPIQNIGAYGVELQTCLLNVQARRIVDDEAVTLTNAECEFSYRDSVFKHGLKDQLVITAIDVQLSLAQTVNISYPALASYFGEHALTEPTPRAVYDAVVSIRRSKLPDPAVVPNVGSFFKNPVLEHSTLKALHAAHPSLPAFPQRDGTVKVPAAWLIEQCGWKGCRRGSVGVHEDHALVLVNYGSGSGEHLLALANDIAASVDKTFGVQLEIEPRVYGGRV